MLEVQSKPEPKLVDFIVSDDPSVRRLSGLADQLPTTLDVKFAFVTHSMFEEDPSSKKFEKYRSQNQISRELLHRQIEIVYDHEELYDQFQESQEQNLTRSEYLHIRGEIKMLYELGATNQEIAYDIGMHTRTVQKILGTLKKNGVVDPNGRAH